MINVWLRTIVFLQVKGGAYDAKKGDRDDEYFRFILGSGAAVAAVDEAVR